ncbi:sigma-54-dependent Fis family transcriptional regulator [bacterium M00.F.Ca.ET.228.01.1.1]|uniref:sigma-54 interaction domain-containing protein n=1 Tax=Paraburkholderia phenoliruptrix TaxID=252970 RepID=UPI00109322EF|nr:sigma-54 dependent transcriptional regulator [Paraburkholderia phenoliruptrix]TGP47434.1 sigma-54-dependent Fis family transcriptional regulator [bacterium M00.F.Ca.ET.228.01.1.1]TGS05227.1 sigma-54-dependent Fis family transcriptional regulator [bacterium M00.F.Ca.ET.191.01.1.1]TGU10163.1 sigma-54-dependent Fis family transcriptional regulator [bacterium M00.F.Ca.ET.155.01.1.1]MBW0449565.1 sigma-54-dependent Fis family transcriptional regulator [Paraburkholderia phenoliruptrix]MBW9101183.1
MMKILDQIEDISPAISYAGLIERIEILRSTLRWSSRLERTDIDKLLRQATSLRDEVMQLSHKERFVQAAVAAEPEQRAEQSRGARRQALLERSFIFEGTFGDNPRLLESLEIAEKAAPTDLPVLIDGESGTGKELMAKVIHANGSRADKPFISVNCGAIPDNLLESELFGHRKGAFTGAANDRKGKFESAHTGTIFLDEIGELPLAGQVKLLRVLEAHEIQRVGSDETIAVDTRIVAATNRNLRKLSEEGKFREDLFYRLSVIHVTLPPLRERRDEIPLLIAWFGDEAAGTLKRRPVRLTPRLRDFLLNYAYPGNIRELRNVMYRVSCLAGDMADIDHLPTDMRPGAPGALQGGANGAGQQPISVANLMSLSDAKRAASDDAEKAFLERGLREVNGTVAELARRIDMNRSHLQMLLKKHGLHSKDFRNRNTAASTRNVAEDRDEDDGDV